MQARQQAPGARIRLEPLGAAEGAKPVFVNGSRSKTVRPRQTRLTLNSASIPALSNVTQQALLVASAALHVAPGCASPAHKHSS